MSTPPQQPPIPLSRRRTNVPNIRDLGPMPSLGDGLRTQNAPLRTPAQQALDANGMISLRPAAQRMSTAGTQNSAGSAHSHLTPPSPRVSPWIGAATSPGVAVSPEAVDYFHQATVHRQSWRALRNLSFVAGGRTLLALGLAGVLEGFIPGPLGEHTVPSGVMLPMQMPGNKHLYHPVVFALGIVGTIVGLSLHTVGLASFYRDTASISINRARLVLALGTTGAILVTAGGTFYTWGVIHNRVDVTWEALPMRSIGNFCVYGAIPNSFSSSEIVHGDIPLRNRILWRDVMFASGGMFLMTWAQISSPVPPAPLYARELAAAFGIICIAVGGALPRVDTMRSQAALRTDHAGRRNSTI